MRGAAVRLEYCSRNTRISIRNRRESGNPLLSVLTVDLFTRPATLQLILQNDAESSFFQALFDVFSKLIHSTLPRIDTDAHSTQCCPVAFGDRSSGFRLTMNHRV